MLEVVDESSQEQNLNQPVTWRHGHKLAARAKSLTPEKLAAYYEVNKYVQFAHEEYQAWVTEVAESASFRGKWRSVLKIDESSPLDLEIGTGNGYFFEHRARTYKDRGLLGIELKYKPLIQSVRRTLYTGHRNFKILRYNAKFIRDLFVEGELNDVFIFFPDPWEKRRENKHRLINEEFLETLHAMQKPGSKLQIKTDSEDYYSWIQGRLPKSPYKLVADTSDLHASKWNEENFQTHFERLWTRQGRKTHYFRLQR